MTRAVHWFRNDLRLRDNRALDEAVRRADALLPLYVLDDRLLARSGPRARFLLDCLERLAADLEARGSPLVVLRGDPVALVPRVAERARADLVCWNRDTTPYARARDTNVRRAVERLGAEVVAPKDRVVFEAGELRTRKGRHYTVYTPFKNAWRRRLRDEPQPPGRAPRLPGPVPGVRSEGLPDPERLDLPEGAREVPTGGEAAARRRLDAFLESRAAGYADDRDHPAIDGTSRLSPYLRFGCISVRDCVARAEEAAAAERSLRDGVRAWVDELVWRDFYAGILEAEPRVAKEPFRRELARLEWDDDAETFAAWRDGRTGYPIVDAGMRQLRQTGWMHNRVRMITASFLCKDLLLDWRRGERVFFEWLVDGDPASNNGGWQWSASTGTDAQPYFRIFNPVSQGGRFDPDGAYVRHYVPELRDVADRHVHAPFDAPAPPADYPPPVVRHDERRREALERFEAARARGAAGRR